MLPNANAAVDAVYHFDWGRIVATQIGHSGDFEVAEEAAQEAFVATVDQWRTDGVPEFPRAWIVQTAKRKAIDRLRRRTRTREKLESYAESGLIATIAEPNYDTEEIPDPIATATARFNETVAEGNARGLPLLSLKEYLDSNPACYYSSARKIRCYASIS